jgi:glucosyl-dolichyl phosphate glucuronosyltransferase
MKTVVPCSVIIPTSHTLRELEATLLSLADLNVRPSEVFVIQNGLTDSLQKQEASIYETIERKFGSFNLRVIYEQTPGLLSGRHRGFFESKEELLVFVDDDVTFSPRWLESLASAFDDPTVVLAGGPSVPHFQSEPPAWLDRYWQKTACGGRMMAQLSLLELNQTTPRKIEPWLIWGLNFAIRRSTLREFGGFHPDCVPAELQHFQGDGESGLSFAIEKSNRTAIYHPSAMVRHRIDSQRMTVGYFEQRHFYQGVCDSYTQCRGEAKVVCPSSSRLTESAIRSLAKRIKSVLVGRNSAGRENAYEQRFLRAYQRGFEFHQSCCEKSATLRQWVKRPDYFDYHYPELEPGIRLPIRQVHESPSPSESE